MDSLSTKFWGFQEVKPSLAPINEIVGCRLHCNKEATIAEIAAVIEEHEATPLDTPIPPAKNAIVVGHGKNKVPLEQLKAILLQYGILHKIAIAEPNAFRPISQKID